MQKQITNKIKPIEKDKTELEKQYSNLKLINLKLEPKIGYQDKERTTETYSKHENNTTIKILCMWLTRTSNKRL